MKSQVTISLSVHPACLCELLANILWYKLKKMLIRRNLPAAHSYGKALS